MFWALHIGLACEKKKLQVLECQCWVLFLLALSFEATVLYMCIHGCIDAFLPRS